MPLCWPRAATKPPAPNGGSMAALLILLLSGCPATAGHLLDRADELENEHHFAQAQTAYRDSLRRLGDSDSPANRSLRTRGLAHLADLCYLDMGDLKCAGDSYRRLIENYPEAPETFMARAHFAEMLRDRLNDATGAIAQYKALATAYPGKPGLDDFQFQAAEGYFGLHDYVQARSEARAVIDKFPSSPRIPQTRFLIASCYELEGQRPEAIKAYQDLLAHEHGSEIYPKAAVALAKLLGQQGEGARALQVLLQARSDPSEDAFVRDEAARLMRELSKGPPPPASEIFGEHGPVGEDEGGMARLKAEASLGPHGKGPTGRAMPHEPEPTGQGPRDDSE